MTKQELIDRYSWKKFTYFVVTTTNPFSGRCSESCYFFDENEAEDYYEECKERQGGRASYSDSRGGMDYDIETHECDIEELFDVFGDGAVFNYLNEIY